ncbi:hypothetical protein PROFUN_03897 [Planoprotostelium fungivorum]|uniref:Uncharacterized protein n=1 Tax=Planoprotostelium fungivorum TaxID=1890364 RepID=A0A2P6MTM1_9EUKA|nr:hypothetical protein PROFUN_03897 [Planoprotostelium fungivorum]
MEGNGKRSPKGRGSLYSYAIPQGDETKTVVFSVFGNSSKDDIRSRTPEGPSYDVMTVKDLPSHRLSFTNDERSIPEYRPLQANNYLINEAISPVPRPSVEAYHAPVTRSHRNLSSDNIDFSAVMRTKEDEISRLNKNLRQLDETHQINEQKLRDQSEPTIERQVLTPIVVVLENNLEAQRTEIENDFVRRYNERLSVLQREHQAVLAEMRMIHEKDTALMDQWCQERIKSVEDNREAGLAQTAVRHREDLNSIQQQHESSQQQLSNKIAVLQQLLHQESSKLSEVRDELAILTKAKTHDLIQFQSQLSSLYMQVESRDSRNEATVSRLKTEMDAMKQKFSADIHTLKQRQQSELDMHETRLARANQINDQLRENIEKSRKQITDLENRIKNDMNAVKLTNQLIEKNQKLDAENILLQKEIDLLDADYKRAKKDGECSNGEQPLTVTAALYHQELSRLDNIVYGKSKRKTNTIIETGGKRSTNSVQRPK